MESAIQTPESARAGQLNENQQRHLLITFQHLDRTLADAEHILATDSGSPFAQHIADATPVQVKIVHDYILQFRKTMARILRGQDISLQQPRISATWAFRTALLFSEIAVEELRPKYMRGYGDLTDNQATEMEGIASELENQMKQIEEYLNRGLGGDLQARLKRLESTANEVQLLEELERITTAYGFIEFRAVLSRVIEQLEEKQYQLALFGRVNAGKSSLLNHILEQDVMPVGVNPVTAVPVRIEYGDKPRIVVRFVEGKPIEADLSQLPEYATEQQNPGNAKHVTRIAVILPHPILRAGLVFVDTPGLGSLAASGEAETMAYLPDCNLGIVLIDAASALNQDDLSVIRMLYESGAEVMVVLSKADLVNPSDRLQVVRYIESQLSAELGIPIPVFAVSVRGTDSSLAESWVKTELHPLLARNQELLAASLKRKIGGLRESVVHTLQHRIHRDQSVSTLELERWKQVEHEFLKVTGMIQAARRNTEVGVRSLLLSPGEILDQATDKLSAMEWKKEGTQHEYREMLGNVIRHTTGSPAIALLTKLKEVRDAASAALEKAALLLHVPAKDDSLPEIWGMPLFDHSSLVSHLIFEKPKFAFLGAAAVRKQIQSQLEPQIEPILANALRVYRKQLQEWAENYLSNLREDFEAKSAVYQARTGLAEEDPIPPDDKLKTSMEIDLKVLKDWSSAS